VDVLFDENFIEELKEDPIDGVIVICKRVYSEMSDEHGQWSESDYEVLGEALALIDSIIEDRKLRVTLMMIALL
jgi:hypothetical protein